MLRLQFMATEDTEFATNPARILSRVIGKNMYLMSVVMTAACKQKERQFENEKIGFAF